MYQANDMTSHAEARGGACQGEFTYTAVHHPRMSCGMGLATDSETNSPPVRSMSAPPCATRYASCPASGNIYADIARSKMSCNTYVAKPLRMAEMRCCRRDTSHNPRRSRDHHTPHPFCAVCRTRSCPAGSRRRIRLARHGPRSGTPRRAKPQGHARTPPQCPRRRQKRA